MLVLFPNSVGGTLVRTFAVLMLTTVAPKAAVFVSMKGGARNVLGFHSFKKNPIVLAIGGSTGGITGTVVSLGGVMISGVAIPFLQETKPSISDTTIKFLILL
jgi:hypothetical protein